MNFARWSLPLIWLAGAGFGLVHEPFNIGLAVFALPLAAWLARQTKRRLWAGYLFGLGFFVTTMSWISEPFAVGPPAYAWMGYPAWVLMAAGLALFWVPLFAGLRHGVWTVALIFGAMEYLRGHIFTGLPWALLAYGYVDAPMREAASLFGAYGLSALIALGALLFGDIKNTRSMAAGFLLIFALMFVGVLRPEPDDMSLQDVQVRAVQPNFSQDERFDGSPDAQLGVLLELSQGDADVVAWPEGSILFSPSRDPNLIPYLHAQMPDQTLIFGAPTFEDGYFYNSAYEIRPSGEFYRYDKQHLVPFGEYIPFGDWLLAHGIATQTVTTFNARKGKPRPYPKWAGPRANLLICYEGIFPVMARRDGDYLVQITNDIWFGARSGPYQHLAAARFRAIENGQPLVRSALTGVSAIVNAKGEILAQVPLGERGFAEAKLGAKYETTIYRRVGDWPFLILLALGFLWLGRGRFMRARAATP